MARKKDENLSTPELNLDDLEFIDEVVEETVTQVQPKQKEKPKKTKKTKTDKTKNTKNNDKEEDGKDYVTTKELAEILGTDAYRLRGWLRRTYPKHKKGTSWKWERNSKELQEVIDTYKSKTKKKETKEQDVEVVK